MKLGPSAEMQGDRPRLDGARAEVPKGSCVHQLFEAQVARTPDAIAVISGRLRVSFAELNRRANRLARHLRGLGVARDILVGICLEHDLALLEGLLAILKAGGAYLPLDPAHLQKRADLVLQDARPRLLLTRDGLTGKLPKHDARTVCIDRDRGAISRHDDTDLGLSSDRHSPLPPALAHVIYTSGSTGRPKGVLGTHRGEVNRLLWMGRRYPYAPAEVGCLKTSLDFIDCFSEIFWPLLQGVPVVIVPRDVARDPRQLLSTLAEHRVTRLVAVPSLLRALVDGFVDLGQRLPHLSYCMSCGEPLPVELARQFGARIPHCKLINLYGSTEVSADATFYEVGDDDDLVGANVPIGRPIANTTVLILDQHGATAPLGVRGELYVGGPGVGRGYLGQPALTKRRFVPAALCGLSLQQGELLFRTGDLGRWLPDGNIELIGRADHQIKIRGFRVEPGEIETTLTERPEIGQAVVIAREHPPAEKRLLAYVVPARGRGVSTKRLLRFLRQRLPEYMVPAAIVVLDELPKSSSGKVDRSALPRPNKVDERATPSRSLPTTQRRSTVVSEASETEERVLAIWRDVLCRRDVGIEDSFFVVGGDSLSALKMILLVEERFDVLLSKAFFEDPTVAHLARLISGEPQDSNVERVPPLASSLWITARHLLRPPIRERAATGLRRLPESIAFRRPYDQGLEWMRWISETTLASALLYRDETRLVQRFVSTLGSSTPVSRTCRDALVLDALHRRLEKASFRAVARRDFVDQLKTRGSRFWSSFARIAEAAQGDDARLNERFVLCGADLLERIRRKRRGVILLTHHTPLFRAAMPAIYHLGFDRVAVAALNKRQRVSTNLRGQTAATERARAANLAKVSAELTHELYTTLAQGGLVLFAGEGRKGRTRCYTPICGRIYPMRAGFAELALRSRAIVVPLTAALRDDGRIRLTFHAPLARGDKTQGRSERATRMVLQYAGFLQTVWREAPESLTLRRMAFHLGLPKAE